MDTSHNEASDRFGAELEKLASDLTRQVSRARQRFQQERRKLEERTFLPEPEDEKSE